MKGEHLTPEFLKLNPMHTTPTVVDGELVMSESRAIACYLANKYAKDDSFYPRDPVKRLHIDQKLYFETGTVHKAYTDILYHMLGIWLFLINERQNFNTPPPPTSFFIAKIHQ